MMNYEPADRRLYRSDDAIIFGVCGGIAEHFDLPPWGVRLVWVLLTMAMFPLMIILYIALALVMKRKPFVPPRTYVEEPNWTAGCLSHADMLRRLQQRFESLDKRLQRMESIVTRPDFGLEQKWRDL